MKFPLSWLKNDFNFNQNNQNLELKNTVDALTHLGLEVDQFNPVAGEFSGILVGEVLEAVQHPNADKLKVCTVNIGESETLNIVCGASNARAGIKACVATVGAVLPGDFKIKRAKLRGVESLGMLCSESELGLQDKSDGIMELPLDAPIGQNIRDYLDLDDYSIEIDLTANRGDCLSLLGIARELSVYHNINFKYFLNNLDFNKYSDSKKHSEKLIDLNTQKNCLGYTLTEIKLSQKMPETPLFIKERLRRSGLNSKNLWVDLTQYIMLLIGQPTHVFDADKIDGGLDSIHVRMAKSGETLELLDHKNIELSEQDCVIADHSGPIALAGIMGGLKTAVTENTQNIILESAYFAPDKIMGKARSHGLHTDASHRFERGVDPDLFQKASHLILKYAEQFNSEYKINTIIQQVLTLPAQNPIYFDPKLIEKTLGLNNISIEKIKTILTGLGCEVELSLDQNQNKNIFSITPPTHRFDLTGAHDLIEEVARIIGYDHIPAVLPTQLKMPNLTSFQKSDSYIQISKLKSLLISKGYYEAMTYSFIDPKHSKACVGDLKTLTLENPISQSLSTMRASLIPGLLNAVAHNLTRQQSRVRLFEVGNIFIPDSDQNISEKLCLSGLISGQLNSTQWRENKDADFYTVKQDVVSVLNQLGLDLNFNNKNIIFEKCEDLERPIYTHPGQCAAIRLIETLDTTDQNTQNKILLGRVFTVHPETLKTFGIKKSVYGFELFLTRCLDQKIKLFSKLNKSITLPTKYPAVDRDFAFELPISQPAQDLIIEIKNIAKQSNYPIILADIFDVYQGESVTEGMKSIALNIRFQSQTETLDEQMIESIVQKILSILAEKYQAKLRS